MSRTNRDVSIKVGSKLEPLSSVGGIVLAFVVKLPMTKIIGIILESADRQQTIKTIKV